MTFLHCCVWTLPIILKAQLDMSSLLQLSGFNKRINSVGFTGKIAKLLQVSANLVSTEEVICTSAWYLWSNLMRCTREESAMKPSSAASAFIYSHGIVSFVDLKGLFNK